MDLRESMNITATAHRCRSIVADRCTVAQSPKHRTGQQFAPQRCPGHVIVASHRCSPFIVADRCTVAEPRNLGNSKGRRLQR